MKTTPTWSPAWFETIARKASSSRTWVVGQLLASVVLPLPLAPIMTMSAGNPGDGRVERLHGAGTWGRAA
ncbi:hypothetical protein ACPXCP_39055 [Streptomyces sp. DT20]|uniref:hypothetical protein n=1 Tax=Streptomyces sp. DT20 TaxID=3416519 RepID=UPI003CF3EC1D